jgi:hypothetical protein
MSDTTALPTQAQRLVEDATTAGHQVDVQQGDGWAQVYVFIPGHTTWARWNVDAKAPGKPWLFDVARAPLPNGTDGCATILARYRTLIGLGR